MSEKLCLKWNDYQENIKSVFGNFREDKDFNDVTLVCEDGQQVEAHKVILASSSPFFQKLLGRNRHPHPLIFMRGLKFDDLLAILDFLYRGEANVVQENLDSFLVIAEELKLRGLMGKTDERAQDLDTEKYVQPKLVPTSNNEPKLTKTHTKKGLDRKTGTLEDNKTIALANYQSADLDQLEEMVKSMMEKSENKYANPKVNLIADRCKVCGKEGRRSAIKDHIEANHIEGIVIPCNLCEKTFRSRNALRLHNRLHHIKLL